MSTTITRPSPCLTIYIPSTKNRPSPTPAFGVISTYSHRIPRPRASHSHSAKEKEMEPRDSLETMTSDEEDGPFELEKVTVAQVSKPLPPTSSRRTPVHEISLGIEPPTPSNYPSPEDPVVYRKTPRDENLLDKSIKHQRRTASIYSTTSELPHLNTSSSISLSHTNVSSESLVDRPPTSILSYDTHSSRTIRPSPPRPLAEPPVYSNTVIRDTTVRPDQTAAAERLKRLYLCPWESKSPSSSRSHSDAQTSSITNARHTTVVIGQAEEDTTRRKMSLKEKSIGANSAKEGRRDLTEEKRLPVSTLEGSTVVHGDEPVEKEERRRLIRKRNLYFLKLTVLTLLIMALMIDLVVLNVKIFSREDWE
ncbi:hypothetical protein JCM5353_006149 [Sporobolomyces roseus]